MTGTTAYTCRFCRTASGGGGLSCPACGAPVDVRARVTDSGWVELPPIADMARIQFGQSTAQVAGTYVPTVDLRLAPEDSVYFSHHVLLWQDPSVVMETLPLKGAWNRVMAGLPLVMMQARGPGHIAFSHDDPGEVVAVPLHPGSVLEVREKHFLVATSAVTYDWVQTNVWFATQSGDETEYHYPVGQFIDRFYAPSTPGLLFLHARGNSFVRTLAEGETILIKPPALLYKDPSVGMRLHVEYPATQGLRFWRSWGNRYLWLRLWGPGRVAIQSSYEALEDPGANFRGTSGHTEYRW